MTYKSNGTYTGYDLAECPEVIDASGEPCLFERIGQTCGAWFVRGCVLVAALILFGAALYHAGKPFDGHGVVITESEDN